MTGYPALSRKELGWTLLGLLVLFLFVNGPVWKGPWDATGSIVLSYLPIPLIVAALLWRHHKLKGLPWVLHSLELAFAKFMVTALFLLGLWVWRGSPPPPEAVPLPRQALRGARAAPTPTAFQPEALGSLSGQVVDAAGSPVAQATVFVSGGLESFVFAPRTDEVRFELNPRGYAPAEAVVQIGQPLVIASAGPSLHTAQAVGAGGLPLFNLPVLAKGQARHVFEEPAPDVRIRCTVHHASESEAVLHVLAHPFFAQTDAEGRFVLQGLPKTAALAVRAFVPGKQGVTARTQAGADVKLTLP